MVPPASPDALSAMASSSGRFQRSYKQLRSSASTWQLIRILILIHAIPTIWNLIAPEGPDKLQQAQHLLGLNYEQLIYGKFWQPITYALIHGNWIHLALNAAAILLFGSKLEHIISAKRTFWLLSLYSTLAGALFFLLLNPLRIPVPSEPALQTLVGASSICFAFIVFLTTLSPQSRFLPLFISGKNLGLALLLASLILALLDPSLPFSPLAKSKQSLNDSPFFDLFHVSHACHFGGALAGWLYARYILRPRVTLKSLQLARAKAEKTKAIKTLSP